MARCVGSEITAPPYTQSLSTTSLTNGLHQVIAVARDAAGNQTTSTPVTINIQNNAANAAIFVNADATTLGNWKGVYGQDGNYIVQHSTEVPSYATFQPTNTNIQVLDAISTDPRALQKIFYTFTATERIKTQFHAVSSMDFDVSTNDMQWRRIALYFCDWDAIGRSITVEAHDATSGALIDSRPLLNYQNGVYLVYNYRGRVYFRVRNNNPVPTAPTASISAFFWGGPISGIDSTAPIVSISTPAGGSTVSGIVSVSVSATDDVGVAGVQLKLDGANFGAEMTTPPFSVSWNAAAATSGSHTWGAVARDAAGNTATAALVTVLVNSDTQAPTVAVSSPAAGTVSGTVTFAAAASDNVGLTGVQLKMDGANFGAEITAPPFSASWDTKTIGNGSHTLSAVARDAAGNTATAAPVTVNVNNDTQPPTVAVSSPAAGTVSGTVTFAAAASDNVGVAGVQLKLDGANFGAEITASSLLRVLGHQDHRQRQPYPERCSPRCCWQYRPGCRRHRQCQQRHPGTHRFHFFPGCGNCQRHSHIRGRSER